MILKLNGCIIPLKMSYGNNHLLLRGVHTLGGWGGGSLGENNHLLLRGV